MFSGKTLYSHSASLHPGCKWVPANLMLGGNPAMDKHPIQRGVEIQLAASSYRNRDKLRPDGTLGSSLCIKVSFMMPGNHPWLLFYRDFAKKKKKKKTIGLPICEELIIIKHKQSTHLKYHDLAQLK